MGKILATHGIAPFGEKTSDLVLEEKLRYLEKAGQYLQVIRNVPSAFTKGFSKVLFLNKPNTYLYFA